jgi:hypothetical protein
MIKDVQNHSHNVRKALDYLQLFAEVNKEIIDKDLDKRKRGKLTARYPISEIFLEATECINTILKLFKEMKVKTVKDLVKGDVDYRSAFDYFYEIEKEEQTRLDQTPVN